MLRTQSEQQRQKGLGVVLDPTFMLLVMPEHDAYAHMAL
jgi:hypothetical protein